jgi:hypothetical protein
MNDEYPTGYDVRGWGYGLATWILASYTADGDVLFDLDADPGIRIAAETMHRAYLTGIAPTANNPGAPLAGVRLVTAHWPRQNSAHEMAFVSGSAEHAVLTGIATLLVPGAWLTLVIPLPAPTQPFTIHSGELLAAAHDTGLGHLRAIHAVAAENIGAEPAYRCALVFRRDDSPPRDGDAQARSHDVAHRA